MARDVNRQWLLRARPEGRIKASDFELVERDVPTAGAGEAVARLLYLSLDPTNRVWVNDAESYLPPVQIGEVMRGGGIAQVVESKHSDVRRRRPRQRPDGLAGLRAPRRRRHGAAAAEGVVGPAPELFLGVLGFTGLTAYFGLLDVGQPQAGETVVVSAAAGATGSVVGQIAQHQGLPRGRHRRRPGEVRAG